MRILLACLLCCTAFAAEHKPVIEVCLRDRTTDPLVVWRAQAFTSRIFRPVQIDVDWSSVDWRKPNVACLEHAIEIQLMPAAPRSLAPDVLAYALPFEGRTVVIFLDRVREGYPASLLPFRLAYVLAHEIGHLLQGLNHHSSNGIMKANFGPGDVQQIKTLSLAFAPEDVSRIYNGIAHRNATRTAVMNIIDNTRE